MGRESDTACTHPPEVAALVEDAAITGSALLSELERLAEKLALGDDEMAQIYEELEAAGVEIHDDLGRARAVPTYVNGELAAATADSLQLFLNEIARYPLLTRSAAASGFARTPAAGRRARGGLRPVSRTRACGAGGGPCSDEQ